MKELGYISSLVHKVKQKDVLAMRTLYETFSKEMLATSQRITNSKADSEDILQDAFLNSFDKIGQLKDENHYGPWLKRIVVNKSLTVIKKRVNYSDVDILEQYAEEVESKAWYEEISFDKIKKAVQDLPDGSREIFSLYLFEGYKHREIAEFLNVSESTSKSQYRYALKLLRNKLKKEQWIDSNNI